MILAEQKRKMVKYIFKNFLSNLEDYRASEDFWRDLCESIIVKQHGYKHGWKVWLNVHYVDGIPFLDGSPIYSLISSDSKKAIAIYQDEPTTEKKYIGAYMEKFGPIDGEENYIEELVVVCELSEESAQLASELIEAWVEGNNSYDEMETFIINKL